jgi:hypothetical protein
MSVCTSSATELSTRIPGRASGTPRRRPHPHVLGALGLLFLAAPAAARAAVVPVAAPAAAPAPAPATTIGRPADLQKHMDKAMKVLIKAESAVTGRDPGRVTLLLTRLAEEMANFERVSGLGELIQTLDQARREAGGSDPRAAVGPILRVRALYPALADYTVLVDAEEASRTALSGAEAGRGPDCLQALDRFEASILAPVLLKRVRETRDSVARSRAAMVRADMAGGRQEVAAVRRALDGLRYAGDLSRVQFGLRAGSEMLGQGALVAAKDLIQKALRDLRDAATSGPEAQRPDVVRARDTVEEVWRRATRPRKGDAGRLSETAEAVEQIRRHQTDHI